MLIRLFCFLFAAMSSLMVSAVEVNYDFSSLPNGAKLCNDARIVEMSDGNKALYTGSRNGYLDLGKDFGNTIVPQLSGDFTISIDLIVDPEDNLLSQNGNFVWCLASQEPNGNPQNYMMLRVKIGELGYTMRYGSGNYRLQSNAQLLMGEWQNVTYVREGNTARLYLNGNILEEMTYGNNGANRYYSPADMYAQAGSLDYNYLARSAWSGDVYLRKTIIDNFCILDRAKSESEIMDDYEKLCEMAVDFEDEGEDPDPTDELDYNTVEGVKQLIQNVNDAYQSAHPYNRRSFWDYAVYHTGNMAAYKYTGKRDYLDYSINWGEYNNWYGSTGDNPARWRYSYGEGSNYALFGDWQCCFQTYVDIYFDELQADEQGQGRWSDSELERVVSRAKFVMDYMMKSDTVDYWWWCDALYMAMPVMTKMWRLTGDKGYLTKMRQCFDYSRNLMYDEENHLFFRDAGYIYPAHQTTRGLPDYWSRGNGWVVAGLARVLSELPADHADRSYYAEVFKDMCTAAIDCQVSEGFWPESLADSLYARCRESSGTCLFAYGMLWGMNNGLLEEADFMPTVSRAWHYLTQIALQPDWTVGYMQPIGAAANENAQLYPSNVTQFGTGAFLLAASEMGRFIEKNHYNGILIPSVDDKKYDDIDNESLRLYDLSGRPISGVKKGVFIKNGKKILLK